jgi:ABC-2 type transport system ATP-binding protein
MEAADVIEVNGVSKKFKEQGKKFYALRDVSLNVKEGEIFGLLGPNGSGKTTMLNIIMNILDPDAGSVKILGKYPRKDRTIMESTNFVSGDARFHWALTVGNVLNFYGMIYNIPKSERKKRLAELTGAFGIEHLMNRRFFTLSTGETMRVVLVKALLNKPKIILMDEPTLGLDPEIAIKVRKEIMRVNKKFNTTVLLTSHYMNEVEELADRIAFINKGKIVDIGSVSEVKGKKFDTYEVIITLSHLKEKKEKQFLIRNGFKIAGNKISKSLSNDTHISEVLSLVESRGLGIAFVETRKPTLEDYFVRILKEAEAEQ